MTPAEIGGEIIRARRRAGLSQLELANRMNTRQQVISAIESGKTIPSCMLLMRVAKATGATLVIRFDTTNPSRS